MMNNAFLQQITQDCFPDSANGKKERERSFLPLRFDPNNIKKTHKDIAKTMINLYQFKEELIDSINTTAQNVHQQIINIYQSEMNADGINTEDLLNRKNGQKGVKEKIYDWLWEFKYPRYLWNCLKEKATNNNNWLGVPTHTQKIVIPEMPKVDILPLNKPFDMFVKFDSEFSEGYLLLLNQGGNQQLLVCPSLGFAPQCKLNNETIFLPQHDSLSKKQFEGIKFAEERQEEFIGIILKELPNFDWLKLKDQPVVQLKRRHFEDLFSLDTFQDCPIFYKMFQVGS